MPVSREVIWTDPKISGSVDVSINIVDEPDGVYFTDQKPTFKIKVENNTNYHMKESSNITWLIAIGQGRPEPFIENQVDNFDLKPGEHRRIEIADELLSLEGHGIVGVGRGRFTGINKDTESFRLLATNTDKRIYHPLTTFSVWDREHYEVVHNQPQRTQHFTLFASVGIVFFAVLQVGTILGVPEIGLAGSILLIFLYWYTGFMKEFYEILRKRSID